MRSKEELQEIIDTVNKHAIVEFGERPVDFTDALSSIAASRVRDFIQNKLGHLRNNDFFRLMDLMKPAKEKKTK